MEAEDKQLQLTGQSYNLRTIIEFKLYSCEALIKTMPDPDAQHLN